MKPHATWFNRLTANLFHWNFHPLEVSENYSVTFENSDLSRDCVEPSHLALVFFKLLNILSISTFVAGAIKMVSVT